MMLKKQPDSTKNHLPQTPKTWSKMTDQPTSELHIWHRNLDSFQLSGADVRRWCNGMFTNNIRNMALEHGSRSAICDDRGRVVGFIDLTCQSDELFFATLDGISQEQFEERFNMYMVLDDIELLPISNSLLHLSGDLAEQWLEEHQLPLPTGCNRGAWSSTSDRYGGVRVTRRERIGQPGWDLCPLANQNLQQLLSIEYSGEHIYHNIRVTNGRIEWPTDGNPKSLIHELNLNHECCAFDKGCYIGQEIINRIDVKLAFVKQARKLRLSGQSELGASLLLAGKEMGVLTSLSGELGLSVLRKKGWELGTVLIVSNGSEELGTATVIA